MNRFDPNFHRINNRPEDALPHERVEVEECECEEEEGDED